jgi:hypothetical protein
MKKVFLTLGLIVLVAVAAAWYFIAFQLDSVVETQIERAATLSLGSRVEVGGVRTNLRDGTLSIAEISVANPPGFENPYAIRLNSVEAAVDYSGMEIKRLVVEKPEFLVEEIGGKTNISEMLAALEAGKPAGGADAGGTGDGSAQKVEPVITIRHFRVDETRAAFESRSLDRYTDIKVDAIEMTDLKGTPTELAQQIGRKVLGELSSEAATEVLKAQAKKQLDKMGGSISSTLGGLLGGDDDGDDAENKEGSGN